jgi:Uma2 family endonuclease
MASPNIDSLRPLRRSEYDQLVALGAFQHERIELIDGALVRMSPIGPPHAAVTTALAELLIRALVDQACVRIQFPFAAGDLSEPEPDLAVVPLGDYYADHPARAHLIVEVAESSLPRDRGRKARLYAESHVPEYWVVNLIERTVEVFSDPEDGAYRTVANHARGATLRLLSFPAIAIAVDAFLK